MILPLPELTPTWPIAEITPVVPVTGLEATLGLIERAGPAMWTIVGLSVVTLTVILLKTSRLVWLGAWCRERAEAAVATWISERPAEAIEIAQAGKGIRAQMAAASQASATGRDDATAREETTRVAKRLLAGADSGLRGSNLSPSLRRLSGSSVRCSAGFESVIACLRLDMEDLAPRIFTATLAG
ncbi:MAG: hypothetical protein AAF415_17275 [Pseudomonadota bacterium]